MTDPATLAALQKLAATALHTLSPDERALVRAHLGRLQEVTG